MKKKPKFKRQEGFKHKKLKDSWRKPKGKHSKKRMNERSRGKVPRIGYGSSRSSRGLNKLGLRVVRVSRTQDMQDLDPKKEMIVIAGSVGKKKRIGILKLAEERKIKVDNV